LRHVEEDERPREHSAGVNDGLMLVPPVVRTALARSRVCSRKLSGIRGEQE
jgi:hypothetical protein